MKNHVRKCNNNGRNKCNVKRLCRGKHRSWGFGRWIVGCGRNKSGRSRCRTILIIIRIIIRIGSNGCSRWMIPSRIILFRRKIRTCMERIIIIISMGEGSIMGERSIMGEGMGGNLSTKQLLPITNLLWIMVWVRTRGQLLWVREVVVVRSCDPSILILLLSRN